MAEQKEVYDLQRLSITLQRYYKSVISVILAVVLLAIAYIIWTPTLYTSETTILLDQSQAGVVSEMSSIRQQGFEAAMIESQVEILKSRNIADAVLKEMNPPNYAKAIAENDVRRQEEIINATIDSVKVSRVGQTYVLGIKYISTDPVKSSDYANAYARNYIFDQIESLKGTSVTTAGWLEARIEELREKSRIANEKIRTFREAHDIYSANGKDINEDQLKEMNDRLGAARADKAAAKAKYDYSLSVIEKKDINAAVAEAFDNDVINQIRGEYLNSKKRLSELRRILGDSHDAVTNLVEEIKEYEDLIFKEMERIAQSQLSDYKIAAARETEMEQSLRQLINVKSGNESLVAELQGLEQEAEAYDALYKNYLEKFQILSQSKSLPISKSRVISEATPVFEPTHPKLVLILGVALIVGLALGVLLALYLDHIDKSIRTSVDLKDIGIPFVGYFPLLNFSGRETVPAKQLKSDFRFTDPSKIETVNSPLSIHAETVRKCKSILDRKKSGLGSGIVIGMISCSPHEGKSTVSINLAQFLAKQGCKCLWIDSDIRNPTLSQEDFEDEIGGLGNIITKESGLVEPLITDKSTGLSVLTMDGLSTEALLSEVTTDIMSRILRAYAMKFQYIIVDLPPLSATSDAYALSPFIDQFILVAEWSKTQANKLEVALNESEIDRSKIIGGIINKADMKQLMKYHGYVVYPKYVYFPT